MPFPQPLTTFLNSGFFTWQTITLLVVCIAAGSAALYYVPRAIERIIAFTIADTGDDRRDPQALKSFLLKMWIFDFLLSFFSFGIFGYISIILWILVVIVFFHFARLWKRNGFSLFALLGMTFAVTAVSFAATAGIRYLIGLWIFR